MQAKLMNYPELSTADWMVRYTEEILPIHERLTPEAAREEIIFGSAQLVDIRHPRQRWREGVLQSVQNSKAIIALPTNELLWRINPKTNEPFRHPAIEPNDFSQRIILMCNQGEQSHFQAAQARTMGMARATDIIGGYQACMEAGWKVIPPNVLQRVGGLLLAFGDRISGAETYYPPRAS